ncbi:MAG: 16S rRNA (guanine(966)-N(2))-methyltransferase RsmD [Pyrinomonadaceae bacterium]
MQILDGQFKRLHLKSSTSPKVRPTARRTREALFEILSSRIEGARFLDLCAGSGAVGIEALSRGASHATFVDRSAKMCHFIKENLELCTAPEDAARVFVDDAQNFLRRAAVRAEEVWDITFFDPPYSMDYSPVLTLFEAGKILKRRGGVLVVEHHCENILRDEMGRIRRWRSIRLGDSCLSFYERRR